MWRVYRCEVAPLAFASPTVWLMTLSGLAFMIAGTGVLARCGLSTAAVPLAGAVAHIAGQTAAAALCVGIATLIAAAVIHHCQPASAKIRHKVRRALAHPRYGNPLHLKDGELLPAVKCKDIGGGVYELTIEARERYGGNHYRCSIGNLHGPSMDGLSAMQSLNRTPEPPTTRLFFGLKMSL